jgi:hypothetical protein
MAARAEMVFEGQITPTLKASDLEDIVMDELVAIMKDRVRRGVDKNGVAVPLSRDNTYRALYRSGELLDSIHAHRAKYKPHLIVCGPGRRRNHIIAEVLENRGIDIFGLTQADTARIVAKLQAAVVKAVQW